MQRAAASSPLASTPSQTPDQHSAKRMKLSNGFATPTSAGPATPVPTADDMSPRLPWNAAGETEWVLNVPHPTQNGKSNDASSSDEDELWSSSRPIGRQSYGSFKRRKSNLASTVNNNDAEDLSSLESGEEADMHPLRPMRRPEDQEKADEAKGRMQDSMNLKGLSLRDMKRASDISSKRGGRIGKSKKKLKEKESNKSNRNKNKNQTGGRGGYKLAEQPHKLKKRKNI